MNHEEIAYIVNRILKGKDNTIEMDELLMRFENNLRVREEALEDEEVLLGAVGDTDTLEEQFLTMECFEAIKYYWSDTSKVSMLFVKDCLLKDI